MTNPFIDLFRENAQRKPAQNPFTQVFAEPDTGESPERLAALSRNPIAPPAVMGEAAKLGRLFDLPADVVARNIDEVRSGAADPMANWRRLTEDAPKTAAWMQDPINHSLASDNVEPLSRLERLIGRYSLLPRMGAVQVGNVPMPLTQFQQTAPGLPQQEFRQARETQSARGALALIPRGLRTEAQQMQLDGLTARQQEALSPSQSGVESFARAAAKILPSYVAMAEGAAVGTAVVGLAAVAGAPIALTLGTAASIGAFGNIFLMEAGNAVADFENVRDEQGRRIGNDGTAYALGLTYGVASTALERVGFGFVADPFMVAGKRFIAPAMTTALTAPTMRTALFEGAKAYGAAIVGETVTETLQTGLQLIGENDYRTLARWGGADVRGVTADDALDALKETAVSTAMGMAVLGVPGAGLRSASELGAATEAVARRDRLASAFEIAIPDAVRERDPERFRELVRASAEGQSVYIDAARATILLQEANLSPEEFTAAAGISMQDWNQATAAGTDLAIPVASLITDLAPTPLGEMMLPDLSYSLGGMTAREAEGMLKDAEAFKERVRKEAEAVGTIEESDPAYRIVDDLRAKLEAAGRTPAVAMVEAQAAAKPYIVWAKAIASKNPENPMADPWTLYSRKGGLGIIGGERAEATFDAVMAVSAARKRGAPAEEIAALESRVQRLADERVQIRAVLEEADQLLDVRDEEGRLRSSLRNVSTDAMVIEYIRLRTIVEQANGELATLEVRQADPNATAQEQVGAMEEAGVSVGEMGEAETWAGKLAAYQRYLRSLRSQVRKVERSVPRLMRELEARGVTAPDLYARENQLGGTFVVPTDIPFQRGIDSVALLMQAAFHGTPTSGITQFDRLAPRGLASKPNRMDSVGSWFSLDAEDTKPFLAGWDWTRNEMVPASEGTLYQVELDYSNPKTYPTFQALMDDFNVAVGRDWKNMDRDTRGAEGIFPDGGNIFNAYLKAQGYDAIVVEQQGGIDQAVESQSYIAVLSPETQVTITHRNGEPVTAQERTDFLAQEGMQETLGDTIDVDGVPRPTTNSTGQPIHPTAEGVRNFWRWFGSSKVVDAEGRPLVVYHGTRTDLREFQAGSWFTTVPDEASAYTDYLNVAQDRKRFERFTGRVKPTKADGSLDGQTVEYIGIIDDVPRDGNVWATDNGVVRKNTDGTTDVFTDVVIADGSFSMENYTVSLETGDSQSAYDELLADVEAQTPSRDKPVGSVYPVYLRIERPKEMGAYDANVMSDRTGGEAVRRDGIASVVAEGFDGVKTFSDDAAFFLGKTIDQYVITDPTQVKSALGNSGAFGPSADILMQEPLDAESGVSAEQRLQERGPIRSPRGNTYMGVIEKYTVPNPNTDAPVLKANSPLIGASTNAGNADRQSQALDALFAKHPNPLASERAWVDLANDAFSLDRIPMPPFRTLELVQQGAPAIAKEIAGLSDGMKRDAEEGLKTAQRFGKVYVEGKATPDVTAKAFLWSFLSRGVSPYVQEGAFLDAIVSDELTDIMTDAVKNGWSDALAERYSAWADKAIPEGSPGRGTQHNLNAFGKQFLRVMTQRHADAGNRTGLEIIHEMIADGTPSTQIRREFLKRGDRAGIDNKVVSFTLLLLGRTDVLVLDRVQVRNQWNDGRFDGQNIYDTEMGANEKPIAGSGFAEMTFGHKGLLYYEAMERALAPLIAEAYQSLGMEGSLGRYHWDSWLLASNQEVGHASVEGLLRDAEGKESPYVGAFVRQGKYGNYDYGFRYGVLPNGGLSTLVELLDGSGAIVVPREVMADAKHPTRKLLSKLASAAKKRGKQYGTTEPWTAGLTPAERVQYDEGIRSAGTPAPDLWQYDPDAVGREDTSGTPDPDILFQRDAGTGAAGVRSARRPNAYFLRTERVIGLMAGTNLSSVMHEMSHEYLATLEAVVSDSDVPEWLKQDFEVAVQVIGIEAGERDAFVQYLRTGLASDQKTLNRFVAAEEKWARSFESYLEKGEAPSRDLLRAFATFRVWFGQVYRALRQMLIPVSPELRGVFDRMLATDEEIAEYRSFPEATPLFMERPEGMTDAQWTEYTKGFRTRDALAGAALVKRILSETRAVVSQDWENKKAEVEASIREELAFDPLVQAVEFLRVGTDGEPMKLDRALLNVIAPDLWKSFPKGTTATDGVMTLDAVALKYGFPDALSLATALQGYQEVKDVVAKRLAETFRREYGDLLGDSTAMAEAVSEATHKAETDEPLVRELKALGQQLGMRVVDKPALVQLAREMLAKMRVSDIQPSKYELAEAREARASEAALRKGNTEQAAFHKRRQLLNRILVRESRTAVAEVEKVRAFALRMSKDPAQSTLGKAGESFTDAMNAVLAEYEFARVSRRQIGRREALDLYVKDVEARGGVPMLSDAIRKDASLVNYRALPLEELAAVDAAMRQIWHHAKTVNTIASEGRKISLEQAAEEIAVSLEKHRPQVEMNTDGTPISLGKSKELVQAIDAWHLPPTFLFRWLDGDNYGATWRLFFEPIQAAENAELTRLREASKRVTEIEKMVDFPPFLLDVGKSYDGIRSKLTRRQLLALAMNWGNASSRKTVLEAKTGDGYPQFGSAAAIEAMFAQALTEQDWKYVQARWDYANEFWPEIADLERRMTGIVPDKIEAAPFMIATKDGKTVAVRGGYYPLSYDRKLGLGKGLAKMGKDEVETDLGSLAFVGGARAQTKHGWTNEREGSAEKPIDLSLGVWNRHIQSVIHDLTHREAVRDVYALWQREDVRVALVRASGQEYYDAIKAWLVRVANPMATVGDSSYLEKVLQLARVGTTTVNLGLKFSSGVAQTLGYVQSLEAIGPKWMSVGMGEFMPDMARAMRGQSTPAIDFVMASSPMMANRKFNYNRDVADYARSKFGKLTDLDAFNFWFIGTMDGMVSFPTWIGAYRKTMAANGNDHDAAVRVADDTVESSQGAGAAKDLARIQGGTELRKLMTMHYTAFSRMFGQFRRATTNRAMGKYGTPRFLAAMTALWFGQVVLGELLGGRWPDDDEEPAQFWLWKIMSFPASFFIGIRDVVNALGPNAYGYKLTPAEAAFERTTKAANAVYRETLGDLFHGADREMTEAEARALVEAPGYWFRLPTKAIWQYGDYLMDWAQGEIAPANPVEMMRGLLMNQRPE